MKPSSAALIGVVAVTIAGAFVACRPADTWMGMRINGEQVVKVGTYPTLDACRIDVGKAGGSCGRNCKEYDGGLIADCNPLITIPKETPR